MSLPDIIKKQGELIKKMEKGAASGKSSGKEKSENMSGEQFRMYQEQNRIKEQLNTFLKQGNNASQQKKNLLNQMEAIEKLLLKKGITKETLSRMKQMEHELLKLDKANLNQNKDRKRKSNSNFIKDTRNVKSKIVLKKLYYQEDELLIRDNLKMSPLYQEKVKEYFKE